jgi:hypothetical protein
MGFEKTPIFAQNQYVLGYDSSENRQFGALTDRNLVFLGRDSHIADRLYITVPYNNFYRF